MNTLSKQNCMPCDRNSTGLPTEEIKLLASEIPDWDIIDQDDVLKLSRSFKLKNFAEALSFTNAVGEIAEEQDHHPLIELTWGKVTVSWWTHTVGGLHKSDFIMAAKTNEIFKTFSER
jgi:4a-hydroxytetrahydrobiopterin dehydratase